MRYKTLLMPVLRWLWACAAGLQVFAATGPSIARVWDEEILAGIRMDCPNPPVHARNLFHQWGTRHDAADQGGVADLGRYPHFRG